MDFYVYQLIDPRNNKVFYVGKGKDKRMYEHEKEAKRNKKHPKCIIINEILDLGYKIEYKVVKEFDDEVQAYQFEKELIDKIGLQNLTNCIPGGNFSKFTKTYNAKYRHLVKSLSKILRINVNNKITSKILESGFNKLYKNKHPLWIKQEFKKYNIKLEQPTNYGVDYGK